MLDLKLPETHNPGNILDDLADNYHDFIAWLISFVALARFWMVHHSILAPIRRCHLGTICLNFLLLGLITLMPFSASLIGTYRITEPWSTFIFAANIAAASAALGLLANHVMREPGLLPTDAERGMLEWHRRHHLYILPAVAIVVMALVFVEPYPATGLIIIEFGVFLRLTLGKRETADE